MSAYSQLHFNSRTAGFNPAMNAGASFNQNTNMTGRGQTPPISPNTAVQSPAGAAHSPKSGAPDFDALLQESHAQHTMDTPPSGLAHQDAPAAGSQTSSFSKQDHLNAGFRTPQSPDDAHKPAKNFNIDSRTAGRSVNTPDRAAFNADGEQQSFSFWDFLDIINPLQHIPIVSNIYRSITGDEISSPARILGGAVFGGPIGAAAGVANAIVADANGGADIGDKVVSMVSGRHKTAGSLVENADFAASQSQPLNIKKEDIIWSQPSDTPSPTPPRLNEEIATTGNAPMATPSPNPSPAMAASRSFPFTQTLQNQFLPQANPTHTYPTHGPDGNSGTLAQHSLHNQPKSDTNGAPPRKSVAASAEERNRKEISNARQEIAGSPKSPSLHEVRANAAESAPSPEPIAISDKMDIQLKMLAALDKYQALKK